MTKHLKLSRATKAMTDSQGIRFEEAEQRLAEVCVAIIASEQSMVSAAGQAALLTAIATSAKVFKRVVVVTEKDIALRRPIPGAATLISAARVLGAQHSLEIPGNCTHAITFEPKEVPSVFAVRCWWNRWHAGIRPVWDTAQSGESWNPLAGTFSAAIAVREVFANVLGKRAYCRTTTTSLWEPWAGENAGDGPSKIFIPKRMWMVGLGHLGQGFLWNLGMLPAHGEMLVLQDYQFAGVENEATGLLTTASSIGKRKARVAASWIEQFGWKTELVERKFTRSMTAADDDPPLVISGLDKPEPRLDVLKAGFSYMIDAGVGHGPSDFESCQIRVLPQGAPSTWNHTSASVNGSSLMDSEPYRVLAKSDQCGAFQLADASVAVPFVGAAIGAFSLTQALRLMAMEKTPSLIQLELSSPEFSTSTILSGRPTSNLGGMKVDLQSEDLRCARNGHDL